MRQGSIVEYVGGTFRIIEYIPNAPLVPLGRGDMSTLHVTFFHILQVIEERPRIRTTFFREQFHVASVPDLSVDEGRVARHVSSEIQMIHRFQYVAAAIVER